MEEPTKDAPVVKAYFSRKELAAYLGLCLNNVDKLEIPRIRLSARRYVYDRKDIDTWINSHKEIREKPEW